MSAMTATLEKTEVPGVTRPMSYEEYLVSPMERTRYDILDGWKVYRLYGEKQMPAPTTQHQNIALNLAECFRAFERTSRLVKAIIAPRDVMITLRPIHTRQPDVMLISHERLSRNAPLDDPAPLAPAPELVVEIVSPSDRPSVLDAKIADYRAVDVKEIWLARSGSSTVEVKRLSIQEIETVAIYQSGETVVSLVFPELSVPVDTIFAE